MIGLPHNSGQEDGMRVGKRGKDLAVRIPAAVVKAMGLQIGDEVDLKVVGLRKFELVRASDVDATHEQREQRER